MGVTMSHKTAESVGSAPADPVKAEGAVTPIPTPVLANKTAPGQTGPRGLSPRTTYSKVNTGAPPVSRAVDALKSTPARGVEFLPAKTAEDLSMTMAQRPTLQEMMKAAMAGTISKVDINNEAARQLAQQQGEEPEKVASAGVSGDDEHYSSEHIEKMAEALDYIGVTIKEADDGNVQQPGKGPGALDVLEVQSTETNIDAGESGRAISQNLAKTDPPQQREEVQVGKANTGMDTNDATMHAEQPLKPIKNENASIAPSNPLPTPTTQTKQSSANDLFQKNLERMSKQAQPSSFAAQIRKMAEDSLSPSKIEAGRQNPPDSSASEEGVPSQPSDVKSQASMVGSNDSAINYKKREAKEDPKSDVNQVLAQPALTRRHDQTLHKNLDNANKAGVKLSSAQSVAEGTVKVAAARAILSNLMEKAAKENCGPGKDGKKKEKDSMMGSAPSSPSSASGFTASSLG